jgi:biopolymer transport protein ExbD
MISIKGSKDYLVALESVAMTDIVMNLFIFFFISFSLLYTLSPERMSKIEVRLPRASSAIALEGSEKAVIAVKQSGEYFLGESRVRKQDLKRTLQSRLSENRDLGVLLKIDSRVRFDNVAFALDVVNELGIEKVSVATVKQE